MKAQSKLEILREQVDQIDGELVSLLAKRFELTNQIGSYKKAQNLSPVDEARERAQFTRIEQLAAQHGLSPDFADSFLRFIIDEVVRNHKKL